MNVAQIVTQKIIDKLKEGVNPWQKTWEGNTPKNLISKKEYRGINLLLLSRPGYYLTFKQIDDLGGRIKKGSNSELVIFYKKYNKEEKKAEKTVSEERRVLRYYKVFNAQDIEGIDIPEFATANLKDNEINNVADNVVTKYIQEKSLSLKIEDGSDRAYYSVTNDFVSVPNINQFATSQDYYLTLFHELVHSTGASSRLQRDFKSFQMSKKSYSLEELVAEIGACFLTEKISLDTSNCFENSVAYIEGWCKFLKSDPNAILKASALASTAVDYIYD